MTRNTKRISLRAIELVDELSVAAAQRLRCDSDDVHRVVRAVVDYLVEEYPGQDVYIPSGFGPSNYPVTEIRGAVSGGESIRSICRRFHISRRTLYRLLDASAEA